MPVILTVTCESTTVYHKSDTSNVHNYDYNDKVTKNIYKNEYVVLYSGQNRGRLDNQLTDAIRKDELIKVYHREKKNRPFMYLGFTRNSSIIQERSRPKDVDTNPEERLQIKLIINNIENIPVPINNISNSGKYKSGKYKIDVLIHAGLRNANNDMIIPHSKNNYIGFYYYSEISRGVDPPIVY